MGEKEFSSFLRNGLTSRGSVRRRRVTIKLDKYRIVPLRSGVRLVDEINRSKTWLVWRDKENSTLNRSIPYFHSYFNELKLKPNF